MSDRYGIDLTGAIRHMVSSARLTYAELSRRIGRNNRYVSMMLNDGSTPRVDLLAKIARECGYDLVLIGHGEALTLSPEQKDGSPVCVRREWNVSPLPDDEMLLEKNHAEVDWFFTDWDDYHARGGTGTRVDDYDPTNT